MLQIKKGLWTAAQTYRHPHLEEYTVYSMSHPSSEDAPGVTIVSKMKDALGSTEHTVLRPGDRRRGDKATIRLCGEVFSHGALLEGRDMFSQITRHADTTPSVEAQRTWPTFLPYKAMQHDANEVAPIPDTFVVTYSAKEFDGKQVVSVRIGKHNGVTAIGVEGPDEFVRWVYAQSAPWYALSSCVVYGLFQDDVFRPIAVLQTFVNIPIEGETKVLLEPQAIQDFLQDIDGIAPVAWVDASFNMKIGCQDEEPPLDRVVPGRVYFPVVIETELDMRDVEWWHEVTTLAFVANKPKKS